MNGQQNSPPAAFHSITLRHRKAEGASVYPCSAPFDTTGKNQSPQRHDASIEWKSLADHLRNATLPLN